MTIMNLVCDRCGTPISLGDGHRCMPGDRYHAPPRLTGGELVAELVNLARAEDEAAGNDARFDREGWSNFFREDWKHDPDAVEEAWAIYDEERSRGIQIP